MVLYADDIIELNEKRRNETTVERPQRRAPGELLREIKCRFALHLRGGLRVPLDADGRVVRSSFAEQLKVPPTALYGPGTLSAIMDFERVLASTHKGETDRYLLELEINLGQPSLRRPQSPPRDLAKPLGLPFVGQKNGSAAPWPLTAVGSSSKMKGMTLERATVNLWTSIFIIFETLMADRIGESLSAEVGCLYTQLDGSYMITPTFKPTNADAGIDNGRPCPEIVVRAVDVATRLGAFAREKLQSNLLFASEHRLGVSVLDETTIRKRLNTFASDVGAPPDDDGEDWHLAPHQLRRFLATSWIWYFELGPGLDALRTHLRHTDMAQSIRYAAGEVQAMVSEEKVALTANILERSMFEGLDIFGSFGKRWKRVAAKIRVKFVDFDEQRERIKAVMRSRNLTFSPNPWGYCAWSDKAGLYARCVELAQRRIGLERPQNRKHADICADCPNCVLTQVFAPFWEEAEARHQKVAARPNIPDALRQAATQGMLIARKIRQALDPAK